MQDEEQRYEYRVRNELSGSVAAAEQLSLMRQSVSVGWLVEARRIGRWEPFDVARVPGLVRLRQPDSATVHAGVLIDGWRLDSDGESYSTFCGPKAGASRLLETTEPLTCKRCLASNGLPQQRTDVRTLIAWHASEIERLVRISEV
ncbi:hypothetical protein H489_0108325 [Curtobacterium flaccumfaciens UCD-AKU]|uniref:hypothetical protein n=1 Tax=Curtobacterium flaccumfaciens TaxID=2035 RepID=UPI0003619D15|nr:hypothetical protein [Curtobacterium flaccumfaciens]EYT64810.1 hypothetical protein H489_0108325 [Curtobacterium flaccumfaciens UCD-AKU]